MLNQDIAFIFQWWLLFLVFGIFSIPITSLIFRKFLDIGYGFAKTIGLLVVSFIAYLLSISHLIPLNISIPLSLTLYIVLNLFLFFKNKKVILEEVWAKKRMLIIEEILFTFGLILWSYVRAHQPDIRGLEKFMDLGFINSILRSKYLPPADMWLAGSTINYYWFGHLMTAVATYLSGIASDITYNLMLATILGLVLSSAFGIVTTLTQNLFKEISLRKIKLAGIISAILLVFGGNFHAPIYLLKNGVQKYWYPDATRFIGYNPDVNDKTIHEFPMYSFVVSDLHAHLINLPVVLLYLALLLNLLLFVKGFNLINLSILGFTLGTMFATNTWDFGTYTLVTGITLLLFYTIKNGFNIDCVWEVFKRVFTICVVAITTAVPFIINFTSIAQGVKLVHSHSPLWQLAILWGFPAILTIIFSLLLIRKFKNIKTADIFLLGILISSWLLIVLPEIIYVKDIYAATHYRANTMFKLTYQAFVMFYLISGTVFIKTFQRCKTFITKIITIGFFSFIFYLILIYPHYAIKGYYGDLTTYNGLDGINWLSKFYPGEYDAIKWLRTNAVRNSYLVEAQGDSYTDYNVISSYTGIPTIQGWFVHEWLWRGTPDVPTKTSEDVRIIYTSHDSLQVKDILNKYNVEYIIVGNFEREKYPTLDETKFKEIATNVFSSKGTTIYHLK